MQRKNDIVATLLSKFGGVHSDEVIDWCYGAIDKGINDVGGQIKEFFLVEGEISDS